MELSLIAIGTRMPKWVDAGYQEYAKRLPPDYPLKLIEIPAGKRTTTSDLTQIQRRESDQMLARIPAHSHVIALERESKYWNTIELSQQMQQWRERGVPISLLIGGPEGLSAACLQRAQQRWSLSALTLPHPLVRIIVAEQLYRAWSISAGHPYHR